MLGVPAVLVLPVAIAATRWSDAYELVQAGFAIPTCIALGLGALLLARRAVRAVPVTLTAQPRRTAARLGRALAILGLALAASGTVSLVVYGLLTYLGERG